MTSTGIQLSVVNLGYDCETYGNFCGVVTKVSAMCNANQMYFAQHVHYESMAEATEGIAKLIDTYQGAGAPWPVPEWRICTEVGAKANIDHGWWTSQNFRNLNEYRKFYFENIGDPEFYDYWEEFVEAFAGIDPEEAGQFDDGIELDTVFAALADAEVAAVCHTALQYQIGSLGNPDKHLIEALRATLLRDPENMTEEDWLFTPVAYWYAAAGAPYKIDEFNPHPATCNECQTCPGCCP